MARKYRVTSRTNTLGHSRGEVFTADLGKDQEARLLARGALERVRLSVDTTEKKEEKSEEKDSNA